MQPPPIDQNIDTSDFIDIRQYLAILWHWTWLILIVTALVGIVVYIVNKQTTPVYKTATTILVNEAPSAKLNDYTSILTSERLTRTYAQIMITQPVLAEVIRRLDLDTSASLLADTIEVEPVRDTQLIEISVEATNPIQASFIANTLVAVFTEQIQDMQTARFGVSKQNLLKQLTDMDEQISQTNEQILSSSNASDRQQLEAKLTQQQELYSNLLLSYEQVRLSEAETTSSVVQVEPALPPTTPIRPKVLTNTLLGSIIGMMLTITIVVAVEFLDDTLKSPDEVTKSLGLPVLGVINRHPTEEGKPITEAEPRSPVSEAFRTIRTNVQFASVDKPIKKILITSPTPSEGKTTIATNLAIVLAQSGLRVTVIDADMRKPTVHRKLMLRNHIGLSSIFVRPNVVLNGMVQKSRITNLFVITSGRQPPNPSELLGSQKMKSILDKVLDESDIAIIDSPPTLAVTDAAVLVPIVDGVIMVMRPGHTKLAAAKQSVDQFRRVGANIIGVILNDVQIKRSRLGYYYYKSYQGYTTYYYDEKSEQKANQPLK